MRLLLVMNVPFERRGGGANRSNRVIAADLAARGHEVRVICPVDEPGTQMAAALARLRSEGLAVETRADRIDYERDAVHVTGVASGAMLGVLRACLDSERPHRVLVSSEDPSQTLLEAALNAAIAPVCYVAHTPQMMPFGPAALYPGARRAALLRRTMGIVVISRFMADYVDRWSGCRPTLLQPPHYDKAPAQCGRRDGAVVLLNACEVKGLAIFEAMARARPDLRFRAVPGYGTCPADRERLSPLANTTWASNRDRLDELLEDTAVLVMPSLWLEGFGMAAVDAMQRGIPVLLAEQGGLVEAALGAGELLPVRLIEQYGGLDANGLPRPRVPPQPTKHWIEGLTKLLADGETYRQRQRAVTVAACAFAASCSLQPLEQLLAADTTLSASAAEPALSPAQRAVAGMTPAQRDRLIRGAALRRVTPTLIERHPGNEGPASFGQRRLWFLQQLEPRSAAYHLPLALRLQGRLDGAALERTMQDLMQRHAILRTRLLWQDGDLVQLIAPKADVALSWVDLVRLPLVADSLVATLVGEPFDLALANHRCAVLRLQPDEHLLVWVLHHTAVDGWSVELLSHDALRLYRHYCAGVGPPPDPAGPRFLDVAAWQRRETEGATARVMLDETIARLRHAAAPPWPFATPARAAHGAPCATLPIDVPADDLAALRRLLEAEDATLFVGLAALLQVLLHRIVDSDDVCLGTSLANRPSPELEAVVGPFVETGVLRGRADGKTSWRQVLAGMRRQSIAMLQHQALPFEQVVDALNPVRLSGDVPLFRAFLVLQNTPQPAVAPLPGLRIEPVAVAGRHAKFDLCFGFTETAGGLVGAIEYRSDAFETEWVAQLWRDALALLRAAVAAPDRPALRSTLSAPALPDALPAPDPAPLLAQERFLAQVERQPDALAVRDGATSASYRELARRASRIAGGLARAGVGLESIVAVDLPRCVEMLATLLGVWLAGGAWLPLDRRWPAARRDTVLSQARPTLIVDAAMSRALEDAEPIAPRSVPGAGAAYVMSTSGSTGVPKSVVVEHRSLAALLSWAADEFDAEELGAVLACTDLCFDLSVFELFAPLAVGGSVVLVDDAFALIEGDNALPVSLLNTVPSVANALSLAGAIPHGISINLAGEPLRSTMVQNLVARHAVRLVRDLYGPTECTVYASAARRTPQGPDTIGRAIGGTRLHLVDRWMNRVPDGCVGEILIGGVSVARGYIGRPGATAESFVPDPWQSGCRLYRTGDRGRRRPDGDIEFIGRADGQVKLRGMRVELGEVEAAALKLQGVTEAAASVEADDAARLWLAYAGPATPEEVLHHFGALLPYYMIPARLRQFERLPRLPNGKLDRVCLGQPSGDRADAAIPPESTHAAAVVAAIWQRALGANAVDDDTDFFAAGGHSLTAVQVVSQLEAELGMRLPLRTLFEVPRLADFIARVADGATGDCVGDEPLPERPASLEEAPLTSGQQALWLAAHGRIDDPRYLVGAGLHLDFAVDPAGATAAWQSVVDRHSALRTTFLNAGGTPIQRVNAPREVTIGVLDLRAVGLRAFDRLQAQRRHMVQTAFDLRRGPLWRACLVQLGPDASEMLLAVHHLVADGWSLDLIARDWLAALQAQPAGRAAPADADSTWQLSDFAAWQARRQAGPAGEAARQYWIAQLASESVAWPVVSADPPGQEKEAIDTLPIHMAPETVGRVRELCRSQAVTPFIVALAAVGAAAARVLGTEHVRVGIVLAGRTRPPWASVVGHLANFVPVRVCLSADPPLTELLRRVRDALLRAEQHQDVRLDEVQGMLGEAPRAAAPFDLTLSFDAHAPTALPVGRAFGWPSAAAKFDWSWWIGEEAGAWVGAVEFNDARLDRTIVQRQTALAARVIEGLISDPAARLSQLLRPTADEVAQVLRLASGGDSTPVEATATAPARIAGLVATDAQSIALRWDAGELTYAELLAQARALARRLAEAGVSRGATVGVWMERGPQSVVAMLGIWESAAVVLGLDPLWPSARTEALARRAGAAWLIVAAGDSARAQTLGLQALEVSLQDATPEPVPVRRPPSPAEPAYLIFTSGTTGTPKAVQVTHAALAQTLHAQALLLDIRPTDRVARVAPSGVDAWIWDAVLALAHGASLWCGATERWDDVGVTVATAVPSLLATMDPARLPKLRLVISAGEACEFNLARAWAQSRRMVNAYGPAEAGIWSTAHEIATVTSPIPIGRPVPGTRVLVLDPDLSLVAPGESGQIAIGGEALAIGYVGEPGATAARFVPDRYGGRPGGRLYLTGDRGRWRADGALEFLGRLDAQVKIAGHRVELQEIEVLLGAQPGVNVAALVHSAGFLLGFASGSSDLDGATLRAALARRLPTHMVPRRVEVVQAWPRLPGGKLDRRALARLAAPPLLPAEFAPEGDLAATLARLYAEVLGLPEVCTDADFFELGGQSLQALQLVAAARRCRVTIDVAQVFTARRPDALAALARRIDEPEAMPQPDEQWPLTAGQRHLFDLQARVPEPAVFNVPVVVTLHGAVDGAQLQATWAALLERHPILAMRVGAGPDGSPVMRPTGEAAPPLHLEDLRAELDIGAIAGERIVAERQRPFRLDAEPLARARVLRLADKLHLLLLTCHHLAVDGWSMGVLERDAAQLLGAQRGTGPEPAPLAAGFGDHARAEAAWLVSPGAQARVAEWHAELLAAGRPQAPRPAWSPTRQAHLRLDGDAVRSMRALAASTGTTVHIVLLSALQAWLTRADDDPRLRIGTLFANRSQPGSAEAVGLFVETVVVPTRCAPTAEFAERLVAVRVEMVRALTPPVPPLSWLRERLQALGCETPLFDTLLVFDQAAPAAGAVTGLAMLPLDYPSFSAVPEAPTNLGAIVVARLQGDVIELSLQLAADRMDGDAEAALAAYISLLVDSVSSCSLAE